MSQVASTAILRAGSGDAAAVAEIGASTFVETFGHLYMAADLAAFLERAHSPAAYSQLLADPAVAVWLARPAEGGIVGYMVAGPCKLPLPGLEEAAGEIRQLYLRRAVQGQGLGTRLLELGLGWLSAAGRAPLYVGVWSGNAGAQRLYARHGFEKVGEYDFPVGAQLDREFILRRR